MARTAPRCEQLLDQLRPHIGDDRVLAAMAAVPRELFVSPGDRPRAYVNEAMGIACGQTISQPVVVARMTEVLRIRPGQRVLDVGTGSGYQAAILAALGARVTSIEIHPELSAAAAERLGGEVELVVGDGRLGHPPNAPYAAICVAATADGRVPAPLLDQLAPGGRLVAPLREDGIERLVLLERGADGSLRRGDLEEVRFVPLV